MPDLEVAGNELTDDPKFGEPSFKPSLPYPVASLRRLQESITAQMNAGVAAHLVVGWASSVSRADGSEVHRGEGGFARAPEPVPITVLAMSGKGPQPGTKVIGYTKTPTPGVPMTPYHPQAIGSCSKVITCTAALAAQWAISTAFGTRSPVDLVHLRDGVSVEELQEQAPAIKIANHLPQGWDLSRVNGEGVFSSLNLRSVRGTPQKTPITLAHVLQMRSYLKRGVSSAYHPYNDVGKDGYYQNIKAAVEIGPVLTRSDGKIQQIGSGHGVYSNSAYDALRLVIAYSLARVPQNPSTSKYFLAGPTVAALEAMPWQARDFFTALYYRLFVEGYVFNSCGVEGHMHPVDDIAYYNIDATDHEIDYEYIPTYSSFLFAGAGGWNLSADGLRKFLLGLQMGKPFGGDASWWHKVILPHWYGSDCPWLTAPSFSASHFQLPKNAGTRLVYHKDGGSPFPFLHGSGAQARASAQLFVTRDATATIVMNSGGQKAGIPSLEAVLLNAYQDAIL